MDAMERTQKLMAMKGSEVPELAFKFTQHLCSKVGACGEVIATAYAIYAQCVEGLPCNDSLYMATPEHHAWFREQADS